MACLRFIIYNNRCNPWKTDFLEAINKRNLQPLCILSYIPLCFIVFFFLNIFCVCVIFINNYKVNSFFFYYSRFSRFLFTEYTDSQWHIPYYVYNNNLSGVFYWQDPKLGKKINKYGKIAIPADCEFLITHNKIYGFSKTDWKTTNLILNLKSWWN